MNLARLEASTECTLTVHPAASNTGEIKVVRKGPGHLTLGCRAGGLRGLSAPSNFFLAWGAIAPLVIPNKH